MVRSFCLQIVGLCGWLPAALGGQTLSPIPPQYQFAGHKTPDAGSSLARPLKSAVVAVIPGTVNEAYVFEGDTGKLFRLNYAEFRMTEIKVTPPLSPSAVFAMGVDRDGVIYVPQGESGQTLRIQPDGTSRVFLNTPPEYARRGSRIRPVATAADHLGNVYVAEQVEGGERPMGSRIRKVDVRGRAEAFAGCFVSCSQGPFGYDRELEPIYGMAIDRRNNVYILQFRGSGSRIYVLNPSAQIVEIRQQQDPVGPGIAEPYGRFQTLSGLAIAPDEALVVADGSSNVIWKVGTNGYTSVLAGRTTFRRNCGRGRDDTCFDFSYLGNGPLTGNELFDRPRSIAVDSQGRVLIVDGNNDAIRLLTPKESLVTAAGRRLCCYREEGIPAAEATFEWPRGLATDRAGNIYVADPMAGRVRKIDQAGRITTILGNGGLTAKVGVPALESGAQPYSVAVDSKGDVYVAEPGLGMIRRVTTNGSVELVTGPLSGEFPIYLDPRAAAGVAVGPDDTLYSLARCNVFRWVSGRPLPMLSGKCENSPDGPVAAASIENPIGLAVGRDGTVFIGISDQRLRAIRNGRLETLPGFFPVGGVADLNALHAGQDGNVYLTDSLQQGMPRPITYNVAYAVSPVTAEQWPIAMNYSFALWRAIPGLPGFIELTGVFDRQYEPFRTALLLGITTDSSGRVIVGMEGVSEFANRRLLRISFFVPSFRSDDGPPQLLIFPKVGN